MLKLAMAIGLASAALAAIPAQATVTFLSDVGPDESSVYYGNSSKVSGAINDQFQFMIPAGSVSSFIGSIALSTKLNVALTSVTLDGKSLFHQDLLGYEEKWSLADTSLTSGLHIINVVGSWGTKGGSYSGTLNFAPNVPEPATWALMIGGFAFAGAAMRRRAVRVVLA